MQREEGNRKLNSCGATSSTQRSRACWRPCSGRDASDGGGRRALLECRYAMGENAALACAAWRGAALLLPAAGRAARAQLQPEPARELVSVAAGSPRGSGSRRPPAGLLSERRRAQLPRGALDERVPRGAGCAGHAAGRRQDAAGDADAVVGGGSSRRRAGRPTAARPGGRGRCAEPTRTTTSVPARLRRRVPGHGRSDRSAHGLVLPGQPLRHPRRRAHLVGRGAALETPMALRRAGDLARQAAHRCSCWCSRGPRTPSASPAGSCAASTAA